MLFSWNGTLGISFLICSNLSQGHSCRNLDNNVVDNQNTKQYSTLQYTIQESSVHYSTQYRTVVYITVENTHAGTWTTT